MADEVSIHTSNAIASLAAGVLMHSVGWQLMNWTALPFLGLALLLCVFAWRNAGKPPVLKAP